MTYRSQLEPLLRFCWNVEGKLHPCYITAELVCHPHVTEAIDMSDSNTKEPLKASVRCIHTGIGSLAV